MVAKYLRSKEAFIEFLRSRGVEPDLRQEGRSLVFATFAVSSIDIPGNIGRECSALQNFFIEATAKHQFSSRLTQLTYSPRLCEIGPEPNYDFKLSHRPSENHVFASAALDIPKWKSSSPRVRHSMLVSGLIGCIERIKADWISEEDRANLMGVFLCLK